MSAHSRFVAWGKWLHEHPLNCHPSVTVLWRVIHERAGASSGGQPGDGGLGAMCDRIGGMIHHNRACLETHRIIGLMDLAARKLVYATYAGPSLRDIPRSGRAAAGLLGIDKDAYWDARAALMDWMEGSNRPTKGIDNAA